LGRAEEHNGFQCPLVTLHNTTDRPKKKKKWTPSQSEIGKTEIKMGKNSITLLVTTPLTQPTRAAHWYRQHYLGLMRIFVSLNQDFANTDTSTAVS
jgi:hypothetical protein